MLALRDRPLADIAADEWKVGLDAFAAKSVLNQFHHLFRDGIAEELATIARNESGVLKLVGPRAEEAISIDVGRM